MPGCFVRARFHAEPPAVLLTGREGCGGICAASSVWGLVRMISRRNATVSVREWRSRAARQAWKSSCVAGSKAWMAGRRIRNTAGRFSKYGSCSNGISACKPQTLHRRLRASEPVLQYDEKSIRFFTAQTCQCFRQECCADFLVCGLVEPAMQECQDGQSLVWREAAQQIGGQQAGFRANRPSKAP